MGRRGGGGGKQREGGRILVMTLKLSGVNLLLTSGER